MAPHALNMPSRTNLVAFISTGKAFEFEGQVEVVENFQWVDSAFQVGRQ